MYIGFSIVAGWFASGVLKQYCAQKTSISQNEGEIKTYPVIRMIFSAYKASEVNLTNVMILYHTRGMNLFNLTIGENHLYNDKHNKTEEVILKVLKILMGEESLESFIQHQYLIGIDHMQALICTLNLR